MALTAAVAVAASLAEARHSAAGDETPDDRLARLESALREQRAETDRLRREFDAYRAENPDASRVARLTTDEIRTSVDAYLSSECGGDGWVGEGAFARAGSGLRLGGYLNFVYSVPSEEHSHADVNRLILAGDAAITDRIDFDFEVEFEHGGVSDELDGEVVVEQAQVVFRACDAFNPKLGVLLIPFGRFNLHHDDPINDFSVRPFTGRFLVPTGFGQPGIGAEGAFPVGCGATLSYDVAVTNGYRDDFTADEGVREARQSWDEDENEGKQVWGRLAGSFRSRWFDALEVGVSGTFAKYDEQDRNELTGYALDVLLRKGPFEFKGEWIAYDYERDADDPADAIRGQDGLWLEAAWHFFPCSWRPCPGGILQDTSLFTLAVRWQTMDLDDRHTGAAFEDDLDSWSVGLNLRITERTVLRVDHTWFLPAHGDDETEWVVSFATYF
jgi:hypothetical protein